MLARLIHRPIRTLDVLAGDYQCAGCGGRFPAVTSSGRCDACAALGR